MIKSSVLVVDPAISVVHMYLTAPVQNVPSKDSVDGCFGTLLKATFALWFCLKAGHCAICQTEHASVFEDSDLMEQCQLMYFDTAILCCCPRACTVTGL